MSIFDDNTWLTLPGNQALQKGEIQAEEILDYLNQNTAPLWEFLSRYRCAVMAVETKFNILNERLSIRYDENPIESIKTRIKSLDSIARKMIRRRITPSFDAIEQNIRDIAGVRVICSFESDVYWLADQFLMQDDITLLEKKDYIANPKENGYRSLHLIVTVPIFTGDGKIDVPVEVQMRTIAMDFWASLEHKIRYKKNIPEDLRDELSECLAGCAERSHQLDIEFQSISEKARNARI